MEVQKWDLNIRRDLIRKRRRTSDRLRGGIIESTSRDCTRLSVQSDGT